jgi:hypothetical protein
LQQGLEPVENAATLGNALPRPSHAGGQIGGDAAGRIRVSRKIDAQIAAEDIVAGTAVQNVISAVRMSLSLPPSSVSLPFPPTTTEWLPLPSNGPCQSLRRSDFTISTLR